MLESNNPNTPTALIINSNFIKIAELKTALSSLSIKTEEVSEVEILNPRSDNPDYIVWNIENSDTAIENIERFTERNNEKSVKILIIVSKNSDRVNESYLSKIHNFGHEKGIDIRILVLKSESNHETSAIETIVSKNFAETALGIWFDRGHRGKTAVIVDESIVQPPKVIPAPKIPEIPLLESKPKSIEVEKYIAPVPRQIVLPEKPKRKRTIRIMNPLIILLIALTFLPFILFKIFVYQAESINPDTSPATIDKIEWGIEAAARVGISLDNSKANLQKVRIQKNLSTVIKRMIMAGEGNPYEALRQAKYELNDLYLFQSTKAVSQTEKAWVMNARRAVELIPKLIPEDKKITVLILLQNNLELRPTGGFIGAVVLLTFDHGKLLTIDTRDIYDLDANLKGLVNPPTALKTYLGESSWFFRDANWSPDFLESAGAANWFLEKEWGNAAEIIVGININTLIDILRVTGPIALPSGQIVGADNILVTAFNHQDVPNVKPDNKKQEFLSLFIKPLLDRVTEGSVGQANNMINALGQAIDHGELSIVSTDKNTLSELIDLGWAGNLIAPTCGVGANTPCAPDSLYINESNVGINKSNFYINRTLSHTIDLKGSVAEHSHTVTFKNMSPTDTWPGGTYKSYIRAYLPLTSVVKFVIVDGIRLGNESFTVSQTQKHTVIETYLEIRPQTARSLELQYDTQLVSPYYTYLWSLQKQPGVQSDPITLAITPPIDKVVSKMSPNLKNGVTHTLSEQMDKNQTVFLEFMK